MERVATVVPVESRMVISMKPGSPCGTFSSRLDGSLLSRVPPDAVRKIWSISTGFV